MMTVPAPNASNDQQVVFHLILIILTKQMQRWLMIALASHDADGVANGITWPKSHVASPFDHLYLTNGIVPLMTHDADASTNGVK